jgi:hypothetical protein
VQDSLRAAGHGAKPPTRTPISRLMAHLKRR